MSINIWFQISEPFCIFTLFIVLFSMDFVCTHSPVSLSSVVNENLVPKTPLYQSSEAPAAGSKDTMSPLSNSRHYKMELKYPQQNNIAHVNIIELV